MRKVKLFSTALAVLAGVFLTGASVDASTQQSSNDVNKVGALVYSNVFGKDAAKDAHNTSLFKDSNGRYGIGQGTVDSTAYFKINKDGTVTIWELQDKPNVPTYKQEFTKKTVSMSSLQNSENKTSSQKTAISSTTNAVNNNQSVTPAQSGASTVTANTSNTATQQPTSDSQTIDNLGLALSEKYLGGSFNRNDFTIFKDSNGRYGTGQGTADSTIYFKINSDGKTVTVWRPVEGSGDTVANQKFTTSVVSLSSLGLGTAANAGQGTANSASSQSSSAASASSSSQDKSTSSTATSTSGQSANTSVSQKTVNKNAKQTVTVNAPKTQGKQSISYAKIGVMVYAKEYGSDRIGADQGLQLTMNKRHSRFILGEGTADSTLYYRVDPDGTVTVWAPTGENDSTVKSTYQISSLVNEFFVSNSQQKLVNETAQALLK